MEPQEIKSLSTLGEAHDPGLVGMQSQPEVGQNRLHPPLSLDDLAAAGTDDDEVIAIPHQCSQTRAAGLPRLVEDMEGYVGE